VNANWKPFVIKAAAWAAVALGIHAAMNILLGGPLDYVVPAILAAGAIYFAFFDRTEVLHGAHLKRGVALLFAAFAVWLGLPQSEGVGILWQPYNPALADAARKGGKPAMIYFSTRTCPSCRAMERNVFSRQRIVDASEPFLALRADMTQADSVTSPLAERYQIKAFPTVVFLDAAGNERGNLRLVGFERAENFLQRLQAAR
jgi:thiol:disulfide interchange protein